MRADLPLAALLAAHAPFAAQLLPARPAIGAALLLLLAALGLLGAAALPPREGA